MPINRKKKLGLYSPPKGNNNNALNGFRFGDSQKLKDSFVDKDLGGSINASPDVKEGAYQKDDLEESNPAALSPQAQLELKKKKEKPKIGLFNR